LRLAAVLDNRCPPIKNAITARSTQCMTSARREPGESDSTTLRRLQRDLQDESAWRQFIAASPGCFICFD
jgi:hypothetical protein